MDVDNWRVVKRVRRNKIIRFLIILDLGVGGWDVVLGDYRRGGGGLKEKMFRDNVR